MTNPAIKIFEECCWYNNPPDPCFIENKAYQPNNVDRKIRDCTANTLTNRNQTAYEWLLRSTNNEAVYRF